MRRMPLLIAAAVAGALLWAALPAFAQDIYGLSFRPTEALSETAPRGTVDIVAGEGDNYKVSVDLTGAEKVLKLGSYPGAAAFLLWGVDMDGQRHNLGVLGDDLTLADAAADYLVAKVFLTAESDEAATQPTGERLYEVTLRNVAEVETTSAGAAKPAAKTETKTETKTGEKAQAQAATATPKPAAPTVAPTTAAKAAEPKPSNLPTTGGETRDLLVLVLVVVGLGLGALRLRTIRV
jgi:hypothetical protein